MILIKFGSNFQHKIVKALNLIRINSNNNRGLILHNKNQFKDKYQTMLKALLHQDSDLDKLDNQDQLLHQLIKQKGQNYQWNLKLILHFLHPELKILWEHSIRDKLKIKPLNNQTFL